MTKVTFREASRRYKRALWPMMALYAVVCIGGALLFKSMDNPPKWVAAVIAVITGAPIVGALWLIGRNMRETDEYTRKIQTDALLSGGGITVSLAVIWSFLELYEVVPVSSEFPSMMMVGPGFFLFYGLSFSIQQLRRGASLRASLDPTCMGADEK